MVGGRLGLGRALVTGQVALSLMLLVGAGLFLGSFRNLLTTDLGFSVHNVLLARAGTMEANIPKEQRPRVYGEIVERLRAIPGVVAASSSVNTPIGGSTWNNFVEPEGYTPKTKDDTIVYFNRVSPGYFATMRTPLLMGRDFSAHDDAGAPLVMLVTESVARRFFAHANPIGKTIRAEGPGKAGVYQVIGVVQDAKYAAVDEGLTLTVYIACAQDTNPRPGVNFEVRTAGAVETFIPAVRAAIGQVNRGISLEFRNFETQVSDSLLQPRMVALLSAFFGGLALLLAMIGLYGVTAYGVARRQAEIGIRMALGAQTGSVIWLVLREVAVMLAIGTLLGVRAASLGRRAVGGEPALWREAARCGATRCGGCPVGNRDRHRGVSARASRRAFGSHGRATRGVRLTAHQRGTAFFKRHNEAVVNRHQHPHHILKHRFQVIDAPIGLIDAAVRVIHSAAEFINSLVAGPSRRQEPSISNGEFISVAMQPGRTAG